MLCLVPVKGFDQQFQKGLVGGHRPERVLKMHRGHPDKQMAQRGA